MPYGVLSCRNGYIAFQEMLKWILIRCSCLAADAMFTLTVWHMMGTAPTDPGMPDSATLRLWGQP